MTRSVPKALCPNPRHARSHVSAWGTVKRSTGTFQGYRCQPLVGKAHRFTLPKDAGSRRRRSAGGGPACPRHPGSHVIRRGTYRDVPGQERQLYECDHAGRCSDACQKACDGSGHDGPCRFTCRKGCEGDHDGACFRPCRKRREVCEGEHGGSCVRLCPSKCDRAHVGPCVRACRKACDGTHTFTPPLPRFHVHSGEECADCLELRGYHRGEAAAARGHRPTARSIAQALNDLSLGESYAKVGRAVLIRAKAGLAVGVRRRAPQGAPAVESGGEPEGLLDLPPLDEEWGNGEVEVPAEPDFVADAIEAAAVARRRRKPSEAGRQAHRFWHVGADIAEAFAPVLWAKTDRDLRERAERSRALGPETWVIDEIPVYALDETGKRRKTDGYSIFCLAVLDWSDEEVPGRTRIRLIRALPKNTSVAWRLVFAEMGSRPDIIVSDAATPIRLAVADHWRGCEPLLVPSVWHMRRALENNALEGALKVRGESRDMLTRHLDLLARDGPPLASVEGWHRWWDTLERLAAGSGHVKRRGLAAARANYEDRMAAALPVLLGDPRLVQSTGGIESLMRNALTKVLDNRKQQFGNIERTNNLMDLVVVRANDGFVRPNDAARLIEADEVPHGGRTVPMRSVADPSPRGQRRRYRSLRDEFAMNALAADRGLL